MFFGIAEIIAKSIICHKKLIKKPLYRLISKDKTKDSSKIWFWIV